MLSSRNIRHWRAAVRWTAVLFRAGICTKEAYPSSSLSDLLIDELFVVFGWLCWWDWHRPMFSIINRIV